MAEVKETVVLPEGFLDKMKSLLGDEYEDFAASYRQERAQGLRLNTLKGSQESLLDQCRDRFCLKQVPWCREGYYYDAETRPGRHPFHEAGMYYVQEPSAMAVAELLDPQPGERILDLCAAPGGKTTHIAERMGGKGLLVANEIHPARAKILSQNVERMGIVNAVVTNEDAARLEAYFPLFFDRIVVDAPCSGEGMFRKDEQARKEWSGDNVRRCAARQQEILDHAAGMLRPGGRMVYSTCTFSPEEDEDGIGRFLERHPEFVVEKLNALPGLSPGRPEWSEGKNPQLRDTFRIWPHRAEGEGHYLAVLKKGGTEDGGADKARKRKTPNYWKDKAGIRMYQEFVKTVLADAWEEDRLFLYGEQLYQVPEEMPDFAGLRVLRPGLHLGTIKKNRMEPSHALAMALRPEQVRQSLHLSADEPGILRYLSGNTLETAALKNGWTLVCVEDYSSGWGKVSSGILKNHYPKGLRIVSG